MTIKQEPITTYHIFTNEQDEWAETYEKALEIYNEWAKDGGNVRLYSQKYESKEAMGNDEFEEVCLLSQGDYPA